MNTQEKNVGHTCDRVNEPCDWEKMYGKCAEQRTELLGALEKIDSNAAESPEWIRRVARAAIAKATGELSKV